MNNIQQKHKKIMEEASNEFVKEFGSSSPECHAGFDHPEAFEWVRKFIGKSIQTAHNELLKSVIEVVEGKRKEAFDFPNSMLEPTEVNSWNNALLDTTSTLQEGLIK